MDDRSPPHRDSIAAPAGHSDEVVGVGMDVMDFVIRWVWLPLVAVVVFVLLAALVEVARGSDATR